mgnify:FL=1|jgi:hypothetical protein
MSSDIYILETSDGGIELEIGVRSVGIRVSDPDENAIVFFDMTNADHRERMRVMVQALQHQLDIHSEAE